MNRQAMCLFLGALMLCMAGSASAALMGHWPLDGDANDVSGNGRHGTIFGDPNFVDGGLLFDGVDDYVNIDGYKGINIDPNDPDRVQPAFSVTNWVKTTVSTGNTEMVTWGSTGGRLRLTWRVHEGTLRTEHQSGNLRSRTVVNDGEWHHCALTVTKGANLRPDVTKIYTDGEEGIYFAGSNNPYELTEGADVSIGRRADNDSRYFVGVIGYVHIYDHTLSQAEVRALAGLLASYAPSPGHESLVEDTAATLSWTAGSLAAEHDVYFGTTPELGEAELAGRMAAGATLAVDVAQETTYYWRVDDVNAAGGIVASSPVWSFTVPLMGAYDQNPADGTVIRDFSRTLSWTGGWSPLMHAVYFGTDQGAVTSGAVAPTILIRDASLDVGPLEPDTTYYLAVDEFYGDHWSVGEVLSLTTAPTIAADPNADPGLVAYYPFDDAAGGLVVDMSGNGNHGEVTGGAQIVDGAMEFDGIDGVINMGDNAMGGIFEVGGSAFSIVALVNPSELRDTVSNHNVGNVLLSRGSDPFNDNFELGFSADGNLILYTDTDGGDTTVTVGSGEITVGAWHEIVVVFDAGAVTVLLDGTTYETTVSGTNFDQAAGSPFTVGDTDHIETPYSGLLDDLRIYNRAFSATELIQMFTNVKQALDPEPADGATVLPGIVGLTFTPGEGAVSHDVYIAMDDFDAVVAGGDTFVGNQVAPAILLGLGIPPDPFVGGLTPGSTYYWRIDEIDADGAVTIGKVWSFTLSQ